MSSEHVPTAGTSATISAAGYQAKVFSVGATLHSLTFQGADLVSSWDPTSPRPAFQGAVLVPWPNRLAGGKYEFDDEVYQAAINEPELNNALHGLACWLDWELSDVAADDAPPVTESDSDGRASMVWRTRIPAQPGYPSALAVETRYELGENGLLWTVTTTNIGTRPAPYGTGIHPYLCAPEGIADDWQLELPATEVIEASTDQMLPVASHGIDSWNDGEFDYRNPRLIGSAKVDHAFTGLRAGKDGFAHARITDGSGRGAELIWDPQTLPWVQVFTADIGKPPFPDRTGIAIEPMTCPTNAFNSGTGLLRLEPGESHQAWWRIAAI